MKINASGYFVWPPENDSERFPTAVTADSCAKLGFVVTCQEKWNSTPQYNFLLIINSKLLEDRIEYQDLT